MSSKENTMVTEEQKKNSLTNQPEEETKEFQEEMSEEELEGQMPEEFGNTMNVAGAFGNFFAMLAGMGGDKHKENVDDPLPKQESLEDVVESVKNTDEAVSDNIELPEAVSNKSCKKLGVKVWIDYIYKTSDGNGVYTNTVDFTDKKFAAALTYYINATENVGSAEFQISAVSETYLLADVVLHFKSLSA